MKSFLKLFLCLATLLACINMSAQNKGQGYDVFNSISKYIANGDAERLSAWFAPNLEISIESRTSDSSAAQAKQILKNFFEKHTPNSFEIGHTAAQANMKYALGTLQAGGETFMVTIFVSFKDGTYRIQQLKIEKDN